MAERNDHNTKPPERPKRAEQGVHKRPPKAEVVTKPGGRHRGDSKVPLSRKKGGDDGTS